MKDSKSKKKNRALSFRIARKSRKLIAIARWPKLHFYSGNYLFLISHMRSRSSLMSHILGSNQEIIGYKEEQNCYHSEQCLDRQRTKMLLNSQEYLPNGKEKYVYDKILHDNFTLSESILKNPRARFIFLVREPESTYQSTLRLQEITKFEHTAALEHFIPYYEKRLKLIIHQAKVTQGRSIYVNSNDLVQHTDETLKRLSRWLKLENPLRAKYTLFKDTGKPLSGDPSENIKAGRIISTPAENTSASKVTSPLLDSYQQFTQDIQSLSSDITN